jgi:hypothetical protein
VSTPRPPIPHDPTSPDAVLTTRKVIWLIGIALFTSALLWAALYQVKSTAEDNAPTAAETAQCVSELNAASQANAEEACPTGPDMKWAAREPLRNAAIVFVLLVIAGCLTLLVDHKVRAAGG